MNNQLQNLIKKLTFLKMQVYWIIVLIIFFVVATIFYYAGNRFSNIWQSVAIYFLAFCSIVSLISTIWLYFDWRKNEKE